MKKKIHLYIGMGLVLSLIITYGFIKTVNKTGIEPKENTGVTVLETGQEPQVEPSEPVDKEPLLPLEPPVKTTDPKPPVEKPDIPVKPIEKITGVITPRDPKLKYFYLEPLEDSSFQAMQGISFHGLGPLKQEDLMLVNLAYYDFYLQVQKGSLLVHKDVAQEVLEIFMDLYDHMYPIEKINLVRDYGGDDLLSMADNNSHCFNDRMIGQSQNLSNHAYGLAIDINPVQNPYILDGLVQPDLGRDYMDRRDHHKGMIKKDDVCYIAFTSRGWTWGGDWQSPKDYQHFEKIIPTIND